jgi:hypothetical protein
MAGTDLLEQDEGRAQTWSPSALATPWSRTDRLVPR